MRKIFTALFLIAALTITATSSAHADWNDRRDNHGDRHDRGHDHDNRRDWGHRDWHPRNQVVFYNRHYSPRPIISIFPFISYRAVEPAPRVIYTPVEPAQTYIVNGKYCREYQANVNVGGRIEASYGTACQQPDGSWQIVN